MTLVEIMVVVAIVALVMTGLAMGIGAVTRQKLKSSSMSVAAAVRTAYSNAATNGMSVRLVFDFESSTYWMEEAEGGRVLLGGEDAEEDDEDEEGEGDLGGAAAQANALSGILGQDPQGLLSMAQGAAESDMGGRFDMDMVQNLGNLQTPELTTPRYRAPRFEASEGRLGRPVRLESGVSFQSIHTEHLEEPIEEERAYVYFFPGGIGELAVIQLIDSGEYVNSVVIHPLTGRSTIHDVPYELPTSEEDQNEAEEAF